MSQTEPLEVVVDATGADRASLSLDKLVAKGHEAEAAISALGAGGRSALDALAQEARLAMAGLTGISSAVADFDRRATALKASVDPVAAAMDRINAEIRETDALFRVGAIGADEYGRYLGTLETRLEAAVAAQGALNAAQARGAATARLTSAEMLNLSRQSADVGVSLAMGMNPLMVLVAQGPQIAETFQMAAQRGLGFSAVMRQVAVSTWAAVAPLLPFIAAAAAVGGTVTGGFALATQAINEAGGSTSDLQRRLGLTSDQMKKLEKDGVSLNVTMGDTFRGTMKVAGEEFGKLGSYIWGFIGGPLTDFGRYVGRIWDQAVDGAVRFVRSTVGGIGAAIGGIKAVLPSLPAAVGDAAVSAVNAAIRAIVGMLNRAIGYVNGFIEKANAAARTVGLSIQLPTFSEIAFAGIENRFEGAGRSAMAAFGKGAKDGQSEALAALDGVVAYAAGLGGRIGDAARTARDERVAAAAGEDRKGAGGGTRRDAEETDEFARALADFNDRMKERNDLAREYARIVGAMPSAKDLARAEYAQMLRDQAEAFAVVADIMADADARAQDAAQGMAASFGKVGKAMGDVLTSMTRYGARQAELQARRKAEGVTAEEIARIDRESARARVSYYGDMLGAAKGFFKEGSDGYRALQAVEAGYRAWQFAASVQAAVQAQVEAATKVQADATAIASHSAAAGAAMAADAATTSTGVAAGAARIFAALGPWGFPVVAAMMGVMASLGAGGGSGSAGGISISERRQRDQGAGSVLGDASAKSESISRSLEIVAQATNKDLEYSNQMLRALRSIDNQIGAVAAAVARSLGASGVLDTTSLKLGTSGTRPTLSNLGFGSTTTKTLKDQGLEFGSQSLAEILAKGIAGAAYAVIKTDKESSAFGITYSSSSSTKTKRTALDEALAGEFTRLVGSLRDGVLAAAGVLGVQGAEAVLASFQVNLGKISLKGMTGAEIEETLQAVFSKLGDQMAGAVIPGLTAVQKVGEGLFETLARVARTYQVVDVSLASIGKSFGLVGVSSIEARQRLVDLFGGMEDFADATASYADLFLTEAERLAPIQAAVNNELARLGLTGLKTKDQFKAVVAGLDVSTAAGAELYAALMNLAPAFAKITEETEAVRTAKDNLASAYERERDALGETVDTYRELAAGLGDYRKSLYSGPVAALSPEAAYQAAQAEFARVAGLAAGGDASALGKLQSVSEAYLQASKGYYASSAGYFADLDKVREAVTAAEGIAGAQADVAVQQLTELQNLVGGFIEVNQSVLSVRDAIAALQIAQGTPLAPASPSQGSTPSANDNSALVARLEALEGRLLEVTAQLAAANEQRAAIFRAEAAQMQDQTEELSRRLRDMVA